MRERLLRAWRTFTEAWTACVLCMVQGDLTVISLNHAIVAAKTGTLAGLGMLIVCLTFKGKPNILVVAWVTGVLTTIADLITHPTHFGYWWTEGVVTGIGAGLLALILNYTVYRNAIKN